MIDNISLSSLHLEVDSRTKKYVRAKIGRLDRYLPRHARKTATAEVKLKQINKKHGNKYEVEVILYVPGQVITAKDSTLNILAAVDIVEAKLTTQLRKYKDTVSNHRGHHGLLSRLKRSFKRG